MRIAGPKGIAGKVGLLVLSLLLLFAIWTIATLDRPVLTFGDAQRAISGPGAVLPHMTGMAGDWSGTGGDPGGSQSSALDQIGTGNVAGLRLAWVEHSGDVRQGDAYKGTWDEAIPLVVGETLYYCTPFDRVIALDAATGAEKWAFDPHKGSNGAKPLFAAPMAQHHCRGVTYWRDPKAAAGTRCAERIYRAAGAMEIVALDAATGAPCADFGAANGHPGFVSHADFDNLGEAPPAPASSPPIAVGNVLVAATGSRDKFKDASDGMVRGFDARDGHLLWTWDPIPPEHAHDTGAANVWTLLSADPARKLVFLATTEPSPDYYGGFRTYDLPYANAVVALSVETGKPLWHYQIVHHDVFDYDLPMQPMLVTIRKDGRPRDVVIQGTKHGLLFVLDRDTGKPVFPVREQRVPQSSVPGEKLSPTQPIPVLPQSFTRTTLTRDDMFGLTPLDRAWCRRRFDHLRYEGMFTPPGEREALTFPSSMGGSNWGGAAYDPRTNLLIVKSDDIATTMAMRQTSKSDKAAAGGEGFLTRDIPGTNLRATGDYLMSPLGIPCTPPPWGTIAAIDMSSGKRVWQVPLGQSHRYGITVPGFLHWGSPSVGGPIVTAGGLVFIGATLDGRFRALDIRTGRELWSASLPAPGMAIPASYSVRGRQYIAIAAGGNALAGTKLGDAMVAFALPPGR